MTQNALRFPRSLRTTLVAVAVGGLAFGVFYRLRLMPVPVDDATVGRGDVTAEVMGTGTLEARVKTSISPRIQERLAEVLVDQNDSVKAGQLLARLDDGELTQQVEVATATLAAARATVERVKTDEARALAVETQARLSHKRASELRATKISSQEDLDKAVEALQIAGADVRRSQAAIAEAGSLVVTAEKNLLHQQERLSFTRIVSPYDGLIVRRNRDAGGVVVPGSSIVELISTGEIWVSAWVDETAMARLAPAQPARVVFRSEPAKPYPGELARLSRETDRETREFLVDVRVKVLPENWAVGQRAEVYIETGRKVSALVVPLRFLSWREGKPGVFLHERGRARWREVTLGLRGVDTAEVLEGLSANDVICKARAAKQPLTDGQRISLP